jgi:hypothetical protein
MNDFKLISKILSILIFFLIVIFFFFNKDKRPTEINIKLVYFKTTKTNLCYGGLINKQNELISITCVPCSNVETKLIKSINEY